MLLRNTSTGAFEAYYISNNNITGAAVVGTVGTNWNFAGTGDFDGASSLSELLLRNSRSGSFELYQVASGGVLSGSSVAAVGNNSRSKASATSPSSSTTQMMMQGNAGGRRRAVDSTPTSPGPLHSPASMSARSAAIFGIVGMADLLGNGRRRW